MEIQLRAREDIRKSTLLLFGMIFLGFASAIAQVDTTAQVHRSKPNTIHQPSSPLTTGSNPQTSPQAYPATPQSVPMDTLKKNHWLIRKSEDPDAHVPYKLTDAQKRILVGSDVPVGSDNQGHQLYKDSGRMIYYVSDGGTKVYVK